MTNNIMKGFVSASNKHYKTELSFAGEGYNGDFNAQDPEDMPLLRLDVYEKAEYDKRCWSMEPVESACTELSAKTSKREASKLADKLLAAITKYASPNRTWDDIVSSAIIAVESSKI